MADRFWTWRRVCRRVTCRVTPGVWAAALSVVVASASGQGASTHALDPIVVTPSAYTIVEAAESARGVRALDARDLPLIDNDVLRSVHPLPGVVATDFSARFRLRGSEPDEVIARLDGMELYEPFHLQDFGGALSVIDPSLVGSAKLYMGGFPTEFGDAMGGVFDMATTSPGSSRETLISLDLLKMQLRTQGAVGKATYLLSVRRGYIDLILELIDGIEPLEETFRPRYADVFGKVEYPLSKGRSVSVTTLYARDTNLVDKVGGLDDVASTYDNMITWGRLHVPVSEQGFVDVRPYYGVARRDRVEGLLDFDRRDIRYGGSRVDTRLHLGAFGSLGSGVDVRSASAGYTYHETTSPFPTIADTVQTSGGTSAPIDIDAHVVGTDVSGYVQLASQVADRLGAVVGARMLWQSALREVYVSPRVAVALRASGSVTMRLALGRFLQRIDALHLPVEGAVGELREPERAIHTIVGAEWRPGSATSARAEVYYKRSDHLVGRSRDVGRKSQFITLPDAARAYGAELFVEHRASAEIAWTAGYAFAVSNAEEEGVTYSRDSDQRHTVLAATAYRLSESTVLNAQWRFHTGTPSTPVAFLGDASGAVIGATLGETNSERLPPFHSLDVRITRVYGYSRWDLTAYFQVINLYSRSNVQEYSYDPDDNFARVEEGFLPVTPTFGLVATV